MSRPAPVNKNVSLTNIVYILSCDLISRIYASAQKKINVGKALAVLYLRFMKGIGMPDFCYF
jgi:hypothetical protein